MVRVCDRCKKKLDTEKETILAGKKFELCLDCCEHISNHIENYKGKKSNNLFGGLLGK